MLLLFSLVIKIFLLKLMMQLCYKSCLFNYFYFFDKSFLNCLYVLVSTSETRGRACREKLKDREESERD